MTRDLSNNIYGVYDKIKNPAQMFTHESLMVGMLYILCCPQYFNNSKNIYDNIVQHTIFFAILLSIMGFDRNSVMVASVLFFITSPGFVFEIPSKDTFYTNDSSTKSIVVHAAIFIVLYNALLH